MTAKLLDGKALAEVMQADVAASVKHRISRGGTVPRLDVVLVGENPASELYVRNKQRATEKAGMIGRLHRLPVDTPAVALLDMVAGLNADPTVHGILVQLPLPPQMDEASVIKSINPLKDVDAFHPENLGLLTAGHPRFMPCTPHGIMQLLAHNEVKLAGKHVVVLGRSNIVGKPLALLMMQKSSPDNPVGGNATVTVAHTGTPDLAAVTRTADILVVAAGKANLVTANMVKPGAVVVDVGTNRTPEGKPCGDVDFEGVRRVAGAITPVPGGVGPMTITMLLHNTLQAARLQQPV